MPYLVTEFYTMICRVKKRKQHFFGDNYYPFGLTFNSYQRVTTKKNRFLYNDGTERISELDLGLDMTYFRLYDPAIGKFLGIVPLVYPSQSPFTAFDNNPIRYHDPFGLFATRKEARQYKKEHGIKGRIKKDEDGTFVLHEKGGQVSYFKDSRLDGVPIAGRGEDGVITAATVTATDQSEDLMSKGVEYMNKQIKYSREDARRQVYEERGFDYEKYGDIIPLKFYTSGNRTSQIKDLANFSEFYSDYIKRHDEYNKWSKEYAFILISDMPVGEKISKLRALIKDLEIPVVTEHEIARKWYELNPNMKYMEDE